jgi:hypothetical protein
VTDSSRHCEGYLFFRNADRNNEAGHRQSQ